jgi:hypothetical protein
MKKTLFIVLGLIILGGAVLVFFQSNRNDIWICQNGEWIRKGSPKTNPPKSECAGQSTTVQLPTIPPDSTVVSFYTWLDKTPDAMTNQAYKNSQYLTDSYKQTVTKLASESAELNYNLFTCSTEKPTSYKITKSTTKQTTAVVLIEQTFASEKKGLPIELQAVGKNWQISNIKCPQS